MITANSFTKTDNLMDSAHCGGLDEKIPPAPGTNQIAGFVQFRLLTSPPKWIIIRPVYVYDV